VQRHQLIFSTIFFSNKEGSLVSNQTPEAFVVGLHVDQPHRTIASVRASVREPVRALLIATAILLPRLNALRFRLGIFAQRSYSIYIIIA